MWQSGPSGNTEQGDSVQTRNGFLPLSLALVSLVPSLTVSATFAAEPSGVDPRDATEASRILADAGYTGGLIVHLGCGGGRLTAALHAGDGSLVHGLESDPVHVAAAREHIRDLGLYGRVSVDLFDGKHLPYADNLVNLLMVSRPFSVDRSEILRVLCPGGVAMVAGVKGQGPGVGREKTEIGGSVWTKMVKPWPEEIDEWRHFLHDASGNAVSRDRTVGPPRRLQWDGGPRWSRSHETDMSLTAAVTSGGRLFHTLDEGPIGIHETPQKERQLPDKCSLVARDAFNGIVLWKRPMPGWGSAAWDAHRWRWGKGDQLWSSPLTLPRRLVARGDRIYVTLGFRACVSELDAVTGKTLREFHETQAAEELVLSQGILVVRVREKDPSPGRGESIVALDVESGELLWKEPVEAVADLTLAASDGRVAFHDTRALVALDLQTGKQLWQAPASPKPKRPITAGTLVISGDVVLFAAGARAEARSAASGELLWSTKTNTSFRGMPDVFVINQLAWIGTLTTTGVDLATGEVARQIDPGHLYTSGHHVRCYRGKATENYLLWSKRGIEFLDLKSDGHTRHDWVRGTCRYGVIPANGLVYAPPHPCFCYPGVKLTGFNALAAERGEGRGARDEGREARNEASRLERGPAFGETIHHSSFITHHSDTWPTYRYDNARSGRTQTRVPTRLKPRWKAELGGKVSPPVLADGRLIVAEVDAHRVTCLDAGNGTRQWSYTAGGPVDSPPTIDRGRVLFGCCDGCVYCLRALDGELIWRFRAAPAQRRIVSYGRIESAWPVHGSVLVENDTVYFAAGRSSYLDGGIYLYGLDTATGQVRHRAHLDGPWPDLSIPCDRAHEMDGTKNDVLVQSGEKLFLTQNVFDLELNPLEAPKIAKWGARKTDLHLVATGGFLDDSGFDRLYWMHARRWPGLYFAERAPKAGQILVFDDSTTYGLHTFTTKFSRSPYYAPGTDGHELFADDNDNEPVLPDESARRERGSMFRTQPPKWSIPIPLRARGLVLAGDKLFLAGPPDVIDEKDPYGAFEGRKGGLLWAVSTADGKKLAQYQLDAPPVFDGLIAARERLFLTTTDGCVSCWQ
jgi:outer membrane protein assembly factor BamB